MDNFIASTVLVVILLVGLLLLARLGWFWFERLVGVQAANKCVALVAGCFAVVLAGRVAIAAIRAIRQIVRECQER